MAAPDFSPPHGFTVNNAFTSTVYRDVYPAVDPKRPELSQSGKVVVVTGASRGIGQGIAVALAQASASALIITARNTSSLSETESAIKDANPETKVLKVALDVTSESSVLDAFKTIASKYPQVDTLVNNAGSYTSHNQPLASADLSLWWNDFETNVRGTMLVTRSFLSQLSASQKQTPGAASIISISSGAGLATLPGGSAYSISKLADLRLINFLTAENPNIHAVAVHPGVVPTDMANNNDFFAPYAKDTKELAGAAVNWALSEEAGFLQGRYVSVSWDVEELVKRKEEIVREGLLMLGLSGTQTGKVAVLKG